MADRTAKRAALGRGRLAEAIAAWSYRLQGFRLLERQLRTPVGEIDLVLRRGRLLVFVEVKYRASCDDALDAVTSRQRERIMRAAEYWLARHPHMADYDMRFDVVATARRSWPKRIEDAFGR